MRNAQIMLAKGFGGAERYFVDLCIEMAQLGHPTLAVCHQSFSNLHLLRSEPGIQVHTVKVRAAWDPFARSHIRRALAGFRADVVHTHLARAAHIGGRAAHAAGIPTTAKTHNYVDLKYYRHIDHFITTTQDQCRYLTEEGIAADRVTVIPNFSRQPAASAIHDQAHTPLRFVSYGRFVHKKGFDLLLTALAAVREQGIDVQLLLGGSGDEEAALRAQASALGLVDAVEFSGWVDDVRAHLMRGDIFVLPSRDEPFGIAVLEAMASGTPIISTLAQGPSEILDEDCAWLTRLDDSDALTHAMLNAAENHQARQQRAQHALQRYRERYAAAAVVPRILRVYEQLRSAQ